MSAGREIMRLARGLGIVVVFALVGPFVVTAAFGAIVLAIGVPMLQLVLEFVGLEYLRNWLSAAVFLFVFLAMVAAAAPSLVAGFGFAVASLYCGLNSLKTALAIVVLVVIAVVALGFFVTPSQSTPLFLPEVKGVRQGAFLALFLSIPAAMAATLSWLISRPLHRSS
jgi:hypothetical protein